MAQQAPNNYYPGRMDERSFRQLWDRVTYILQRLEAQDAETVPKDVVRQADLAGLRVAIQAVQDDLTQSQTFVNAGNNAFTPTDQTALAVAGSGDGITLSGQTDSIVVNVSSPAALRSAAEAARVATPAIVGATITLAKITGGGTDGSLTVNSEGIITSYIVPT